MKYTSETFLDNSNDGKDNFLHYLKNSGGTVVAIMNYGARWAGLWLPVDDKFVDVVAGFKSIAEYKSPNDAFYGAIVGRYANRIANGKFSLNGKDYILALNNPPNHLHGGDGGFHNVMWNVAESSTSTISLEYISSNGEEGYPGELQVTVTYTLNDENELHIEISATSSEDTIVNITSHAYFNLNGEGSGTIEEHIFSINASSFTPVNRDLIPTGDIMPVEGTPFDFRNGRSIAGAANFPHQQLQFGKGYDHNFVCDGNGFRKIAQVSGERVIMEMYTDQPGVQFYSGNFMEGKNTFRSGAKDDFRTAFCLEAQHFPDSPNQSNFPAVVLKKGDVYTSNIRYCFKVV